jgi:hypothetical protein
MLFFCNCFFCKSHCDKVAITHMLVFSNSFLLQSPNISGCNLTVTYFAIIRIFIRLQHNQANTNLVAIWQCHDMELFLTGFLQSQFFTCFCNCFFNSNHKLFFASAFLQSKCYKVAITLAIRLQSFTRDKVANHAHACFSKQHFFAIVAHQWLQPHFNLFCNHPYFHQVSTTSSKY